MLVTFKPENHQYESPDVKWTSVTSFISQFKKPFHASQVAKKCSKNPKSKWFKMKEDDILKAWESEGNRATTLGTWYHEQREKDLCSISTIEREGKDLEVVRPLIKDGVKYAPLQKLDEKIYPEHFIYLVSVGLCGQADLVEVVNGKVHITDYKTSKEIKTHGYKNWEGIVSKMLHPVGHLDDCNINHYALQLSLYMFIILRHNPNLNPGRLTLHHIIFEEVGKDKYGNPIPALHEESGEPIVKEVIPYDLPYLKMEVMALINYHKKH